MSGWQYRHLALVGRVGSTRPRRTRWPTSRGPKGCSSPIGTRTARLGEHRNLILQAACRGAVRRCIGDQGEAMDLYLIAAKRTGIPHLLREVFPGAKLKGDWSPIGKPLKGKVKDAIDYIRRHIKSLAHRYEPLSFVEVQKAIGMKHRQNFNQDIRSIPSSARLWSGCRYAKSASTTPPG